LGVPVVSVTSGPFKALRHGNVMLEPFQRRLIRVYDIPAEDGQYVLHMRDTGAHLMGHFVGVEVTAGHCTVFDDGTSRRFPSASDAQGGKQSTWFRMVRVLPVDEQRRVGANRAVALRIRSDRLAGNVSKRARLGSPALTADQLATIQANREAAEAVRRSQLVRPMPPLGWAHPQIPSAPSDFLRFDVVLPEVRWLSTLNEHPRDRNLVFQASSHTYLVNGAPTLGSVTGLIHAFCEPFDADHVIQLMSSGRQWPRPGYLKAAWSQELVNSIRAHPLGDGLADLMEAHPRDEGRVCMAAREFARTSPAARALVNQLSLGAQDIKLNWDLNRNSAANQGTWMHYLLEAWLNRCSTPGDSVEETLFLNFAKTLEGLTAYRTEWAIFGEAENLAGSIDFTAIDSMGRLHLFDWKRSKDLKSKYSCRFRQMRDPLNHLDDCSGIHYRLQLNCLDLSGCLCVWVPALVFLIGLCSGTLHRVKECEASGHQTKSLLLVSYRCLRANGGDGVE